jgi:hypothetical protein
LIQSLKSLMSRMNRKPERWIVRIQPFDGDFVALWKDGSNEEVKWSEVERIFTYKVDCYAYDTIWLAFERNGHDDTLHIREEAKGFQDLMSAMSEALPEINQEWVGRLVISR